MNYIHLLMAFFKRMESDERLNPNHVSLYMALFQVWNLNRFKNPVSIYREQVLKLSRIGSHHTYYKCLYDLHDWNYLVYHPSSKPIKGSLISFCNLDEAPDEPVDSLRIPGSKKQEETVKDAELPLFGEQQDIVKTVADEIGQKSIYNDAEMQPIECNNDPNTNAELHPTGAKNEYHILHKCTNYTANMQPIDCKNDTGYAANVQPSLNNININSKTKKRGRKKHAEIFQNEKTDFFKNNSIEVSLNAQKDKRKKVAPKKEKVSDITMPFSSTQFAESWNRLIQMPKWKNKQPESLKSALEQLAKYDEEFAIHLIKLAVTNEWRGVVFLDTDKKYKEWTQNKSDDANKNVNERTGSAKVIAPEFNQPKRNYKERF